MKNFKFGKKSLKLLDTVNRYLKLCALETIKESAIDISIPDWGGYRSAEYQNEIFKKGWSKVDGYKIKSNHQKKDSKGKSIALDLCAYANGELSWDKERLIYIATLYRCIWDKLKVEGQIPQHMFIHSGMLWSAKEGMGWDRPHHEIRSSVQAPNIKS